MQSSNNQKTEKHLNDLSCHLNELELGIDTFQTEHNRDKSVYLFCEMFKDKIKLISNILFHNNLFLVIHILTEVNRLFMEDKVLRSVTIKIDNTKRPNNPTAIAYLKIEV